MTLKRSTRSAFLLSVLSLILCFSMLLGTTFAWFTDTAKTGVNKIQAGTLKVDLLHKVVTVENEEEKIDWISVKDDPDHPIWYYDLWEPGYTQYETVKIVNEGTLALKFKLTSSATDAKVGENGEQLSDVIDVYVANGDVEKPDSFEAIKADAEGTNPTWRNAGVLTDILQDADGIAYGVLLPKDSKGVIDDDQKAYTAVESTTMTIALHMREEVGNEYQELTLGNMYVTLLATQESYEEDSFDHKYDDGLMPVGEGETIVEENNVQYLYTDDGEVYLYLVTEDYAEETLVIPEGVTALGNYSFTYNNNVKTVILSDTVRSLGRAFDSSSVEKVVLNEGLEQIDSRAFKATSNLEEVVISSTVKVIEDNAFQKSGIKKIVIPATVETIGETAFGASLIEEVTFEGNTSVQGYAFRGCAELRTVRMYGDDIQFITSTLNNRNSCWFCNSESNNPGTSDITFYVTNDTMKARVQTAMGAEADNTTIIKFNVVEASDSTSLQSVIEAASSEGETVITLAAGTYEDNIDLTVAALGTDTGDFVFKAAKDADVVIAGTVTLGYRNQGTGATMINSNVTFEGITFDHANDGAHSIDVQDVKSLTLKNCTIIGDGEYGINSARGNGTGKSTIVGCTFKNAAMQILGNFGTGLVIDDCDFEDSRINVQAGNGVTIQNCDFNSTISDSNVGESFYLVRSNSTPITVKNCEIVIDSTVTEVATSQAKWGAFWNRGTTNWTVENVNVTLTDAATAQTDLLITKTTSTGVINSTNLKVNGVVQ